MRPFDTRIYESDCETEILVVYSYMKDTITKEQWKMTKDVLLSIKGLQFANEQDTEPVEVITSGDYYKRNGMWAYNC